MRVLFLICSIRLNLSAGVSIPDREDYLKDRRYDTTNMKIFIIVLIVLAVLVLLSVFAPKNSQRKFWIIIKKIRNAMDSVCYWFFNICAIAVILYIVYMVVRHLLAN